MKAAGCTMKFCTTRARALLTLVEPSVASSRLPSMPANLTKARKAHRAHFRQQSDPALDHQCLHHMRPLSQSVMVQPSVGMLGVNGDDLTRLQDALQPLMDSSDAEETGLAVQEHAAMASWKVHHFSCGPQPSLMRLCKLSASFQLRVLTSISSQNMSADPLQTAIVLARPCTR